MLQGAGGLEGQLREDFQSLVHQHRLEEAHSTDSTMAEKEELSMFLAEMLRCLDTN